MNKIKNMAMAALLTIGTFGIVTFTACTKDACKDVVCNNGGTCVSGSCSCKTGYEGTNCETLTRDKFVGTWKGTDVCGSGSYVVTLTLSASSNDVNILINNPGGFGTNITTTGDVASSSTIKLNSVSVGGSRTLSGTMTFSGSTTAPTAMAFSYTVTPSTGSADNCVGNYIKQ